MAACKPQREALGETSPAEPGSQTSNPQYLDNIKTTKNVRVVMAELKPSLGPVVGLLSSE